MRRVQKRYFGLAAAMLGLACAVQAQDEGRRQRGRRGIAGDWHVSVQFGDREISSILSFSRGEDRSWKGEWISFWGAGELQDVKLEENKLSFTRIFRFGGNESTSRFSGTIEDGKLTGTLSSERGDAQVRGERPRRLPRAAGSWDMLTKAGDREYKGTLIIKASASGELAGEWKSERGEHKVSDLKLDQRAMTFKRTITLDDGSTLAMSFEGTLERDGIVGVFKSDRGEAQATGKRIGAAAIGRWDVEIATDDGTRKQRLTVHRDLSGYWGSVPIEKVEIEGDKVRFKTSIEFGDRTFEQSFAGSIQDGTLSGELTSQRGTRKVTGKKRSERSVRPARAGTL